ncbi:hypothetical protein H2248_003433 [Termitomyces sp. 'cryptogamus']|nr:hypothetical protein H2248_003433 [Termitomyces sp. 'cryptogamus']
MMDTDVALALVKETAAVYASTDMGVVLSLACTCRAIRHAALGVVFASVRWPHAGKYDEEGLLFFPVGLWGFFRRFELVWPEEWAEATPPRWGDRYYVGGDYNPRHVDKLVGALPGMRALTSFYLHCPFFPPNALVNALVEVRTLRELTICETPLSISSSLRVPEEVYLERLCVVPVGEAVRVGDGPVEGRYGERTYYVREYRKKYRNDVLARDAVMVVLEEVGKAARLRHVQVSLDLCTLGALAELEWPAMETLVLTGHARRSSGAVLDVLARMPRLCELRLLLAKVKGEAAMRIVGDQRANAGVLRQLRWLAVSNACELGGVFCHTTGLERLAVLAIIDMPRVPIAMGRAEIERVLRDLASAPCRLKRLRLMIEDKVNPDLCSGIAALCPGLEALEIELCGYHDGKSIHAWEEFSDAFVPMAGLRELRICIQFPEFDEMDTYEPWRAARVECATYLAGRIASLERVGLEYRKRTGTHRFEDSWLEFDVERDGARVAKLVECAPTWYPFPDVWFPVEY